MDIMGIISRLGEKEKKLLSSEIISPVYGNRQIATKVAGAVYRLNISRTSPGWYKFRVKNSREAERVSEADLSDRDSYLNKLPRLRMVLVRRDNYRYLAVPCRNPFKIEPSEACWILLVDDQPMDFDTVVVRFDGVRFWYHEVDLRSDPSKSDYLRESFNKGIENLEFPGLTHEDKTAYSLRCAMDVEAKKQRSEYKIQRAVEHGGGDFVSFLERSDHFSVTYKVDGRQYTSTVKKDSSMEIISAGICLDGNDKLFDLKSLIPVLKEGHRTNAYFEVYNPND